MYKKFLLMFILFSTFVYATSVDVDLNKTRYSQNESILGSINITIDSEMDLNTYLEVEVGDQEQEILFTDLLGIIQKSYQASSGSIQEANPFISKIVTNSESLKDKLFVIDLCYLIVRNVIYNLIEIIKP